MILKTEIEVNGITVEIEALHVPAERGCRDKFGVPLEPDYDAYFDIIDTVIDGKSYDDDQLFELIGFDISDKIQESLHSEYEYQYESYFEIGDYNYNEL